MPLQQYAFNPRLTANYKKTLSEEDHTDLNDALVIVERLRMGRDLPRPFAPDLVYQPLRLLTRYRFHSCEAILTMPLETLAAWLDEQGHHRFADPTATARQLQTVARESFALPGAFQAPVNLCLDSALSQIAALEQHLQRLDAAIAERLRAIPHTLTTIRGIGPVFAAGLLAEIGDIRRFDGDDDKIAKFAGFKWRRHQSADFEAEETPITRRCNHYLHYYFCEAANPVRIHEPEYAAFYQKKYAEMD